MLQRARQSKSGSRSYGKAATSSIRASRASKRHQSWNPLNSTRLLSRILIALFIAWLLFVGIFMINMLSSNKGDDDKPAAVRFENQMVSDNKLRPKRPTDGKPSSLDLNPHLQSGIDSAVQNAPMKPLSPINLQPDKPLYQQSFFDEIELDPLPFSQPDSVFDSIVHNFYTATYKPPIEEKLLSNLAKWQQYRDTAELKKKEEKAKQAQVELNKAVVVDDSSNSGEESRYKCLYYCDKPHNRECVLKQLKYWTKGNENLDAFKNDLKTMSSIIGSGSNFLSSDNQVYPRDFKGYITFKNDCGGFNNIRQAFEFFVTSAWLTQRSLVFPVTEGWYLIDWGPMKRAVPQDTSGTSNYWLFFDTNDMAKVIHLSNMTDFLKVHTNDIDLPEEYRAKPRCEEWNWDNRQHYKKWLNEKSVADGFAPPWGPNHNVLMWPDTATVEASQNSKFALSKNHDDFGKVVDLGSYVGHRVKQEYVGTLRDSPYLNFPSCVDSVPNGQRDYRYLCQVASTTAFADYSMELKFKRMIRDHVHLHTRAFEIASYIIADLGLFQYSSAHIRRNDFQFKNAWQKPQSSFDNINPHLNENEILYIASDAPTSFFDEVSTTAKIVRWVDYFGDEFEPDYEDVADKKPGENQFKGWKGEPGKLGKIREQFPDLVVPRKLIGLIEMIVCSGGRMFFGTTSSTYTAYINRLRGYIDAPDKQVFMHNNQGAKKWKYNPTEYMREFADMWEDIKDYC